MLPLLFLLVIPAFAGMTSNSGKARCWIHHRIHHGHIR
jgi:hypothetical protein